MMKKILTIALTMLMLVCVSCTSNAQQAKSQKKDSDKVEVLYFHGKQRCKTCVAVGKFSEELVKELGDAKVVWREVDLSTKDGERLGDKYEVVGSGLVVARGGKGENLTRMAFSYALSDTPRFKAELKKEIERKK